MAVIQFKLEGAIIKRHPEFHMDHRLLLDKIDYKNRTIVLQGKTYSLKDASFPTIDPEDPYRLTEEEEAVVVRLVQSFRNSERLQEHISFMIDKGMIYLPYNDNLLFHGCLPVHEDGSLMALEVEGKLLAGKELFDAFDYAVRQGFNLHRKNRPNEHYLDLMWYLWTGPASPLFGKEEMTTFERYYIEDKETHAEKKNAYFELRN